MDLGARFDPSVVKGGLSSLVDAEALCLTTVISWETKLPLAIWVLWVTPLVPPP